jgi:hypothetical protein
MFFKPFLVYGTVLAFKYKPFYNRRKRSPKRHKKTRSMAGFQAGNKTGKFVWRLLDWRGPIFQQAQCAFKLSQTRYKRRNGFGDTFGYGGGYRLGLGFVGGRSGSVTRPNRGARVAAFG